MRTVGRHNERVLGDDVLKYASGPWWLWAVFSVFMGFGQTQETARRLAGSTGWSLAGGWLLLALSVFTFCSFGWIAVLKFRERHPHHAG